MNVLWHDLRYALRQLRKSPGFTLTAVLTLAIGIGATTAIFSLIWSVMLKPLPVEHPKQLYKIGSKNMCCTYQGMEGDWALFSNDLYEHFRDHTKGFESLAAFQAGTDTFTVRRSGDAGKADASEGNYVSGNYFSTLGAPILRGRAFTMADDREGAPPVAVISYRYWRQRFALDPSIIGGTLLINGRGVTVVGVTPPEFYGVSLKSNPPDFWIPVHQEVNLTKGQPLVTNPHRSWLDLVGRVAPSASIRSIDAQLNTELRQWLQTQIAFLEAIRPGATQLIPQQQTELAPAAASANSIANAYRKGLMLLLWAALAVLLIVCANVASLMLVRAAAHRQQTAISVALGAARGDVIRQSLVFSVVLAVLGGVAALAVSYAVTNMMLELAFRGSPHLPLDAAPSWPVLAFAFGAALVTGIAFGAVPAWLSSRAHPAEALRGADRGSSGDASARPQQVLVVFQAALSVVLLCVAGLLLRSLDNLEHQDFGFQTQGRVIAQINPALAGVQHKDLDAFYQRLRDRLGRIPGVAAVSYAEYAPMTFWNNSRFVFFSGRTAPGTKDHGPSYNTVGPHYFEVTGTRILRGRPITEEDDNNSRHVAVVNEAFAKKYLDGHAIGQHFGMQPQLSSEFEIVGVSENTKYNNPSQPAPPMFFLPIAQSVQVAPSSKPEDAYVMNYAGDVILAFHGSAAGKEQEVRTALTDVNPGLLPQYVHTFEDQVNLNLNGENLIARLTLLFGLTALVLAAIGLYGVTSYSVARRTGEIGIRMALGADRMRVMRAVMRRAMAQALLGLALGIPLAWLAGRLLAGRVYQVSAFDPLIVTVTVTCLAVSALLAALLPARRAASVNPVEALRNE